MASATQKATADAVIQIPPIEIKTYVLRIVGDSPLITHAWSEKAKKEMRDKVRRGEFGQVWGAACLGRRGLAGR